jgi:hypothetical protein
VKIVSDLIGNGYRMETWDIRERDIDLLLIEELYASPSFRQNFLQLLGGEVPSTAEFIAARHSIVSSLGQSDVEVELAVAKTRWILLLENKIDASFQPEQAARYTQRGEQYLSNGYARFLTILIAPEKYFRKNRCGFHLTVSYENLLEWFSKADMLGGRRQCKVGILKAAIEKYEDEDGGPGAKNPLSVDFFRKYWKRAQMLAPELGMRDEPKDGGFLYFHPANLPKYLKLMHRIRQGYVDLQFSGMAESSDELRLAFSKVLPGDFHVRKVGGSAAIGVKVEQLIREKQFEPQRSRAENGIRQAKRLWVWFLTNRDDWEQSQITRQKGARQVIS